MDYGHVIPQLSKQNIPNLKDIRIGNSIPLLSSINNFEIVKPLTINEPKKETPDYKEYRYENIGRHYNASTNLFKSMYIANNITKIKTYRQDIEYIPPTFKNHELYGSTGAVYNAFKDK